MSHFTPKKYYARVTGTTETVVHAGRVKVFAVVDNQGSGTVTLRDDAAADGGASVCVLTATGLSNLDGVEFSTGLTAQGSAAGTDVTIVYQPVA